MYKTVVIIFVAICIIGFMLACSEKPSPPPGPTPPTVIADTAVEVTTNSAKLVGTVNLHGHRGSAYFAYDTTIACNNKTSEMQFIHPINRPISVEARISGLVDDKLYYFQLLAFNGDSTFAGAQNTFRTVAIAPPETVSTPTMPSGLDSAEVDESLTFSTGGSVSNLGHSVDYRFDWDDEGYSSWSSSTSESHAWSDTGTYSIRAQARCSTHTSVVSTWSSPKTVTITAPETVSTPTTPSGSDSPGCNQTASYSTGAASSNLGHSVEYQFDWGDGSQSSWGLASQLHSWSGNGSYCVMARARCVSHTSVMSGWSSCKTVTIGDCCVSETVSAPSTPSGLSSGEIDSSLAYNTGGSSSSCGHTVQYRFDWNDGTYSSWSLATSESYSWSVAGIYSVRAQARCATDTSVVSTWSSPKTVTIMSPETWSPLGSGMNNRVWALTVYDNKLIAGGEFATAGGVAADYIAAWDGSSWSPLGTGMDDYVDALTVYHDKLIAGGYFTTAGGGTAEGIASWDGSSWSPLGLGIGGSYTIVNALTVYDDRLIVGGMFTTAGGVVANNIAAWDGSSWSTLGSGMNTTGQVLDLMVYDNKLIAGGEFTTAGGMAVNRIAVWDRSSWTPLSSGMNDPVTALTGFGNKLIAGGIFTSAGGMAAVYIAAWDGSSWSPLGTEMDDFVNALTVLDDELIAGGYFTMAGGETAIGIASWDGSSWSPIGLGMGGFIPWVKALAVYDFKLIAGGMFTTAGGVAANRIAQWGRR